MGLGPSEVLTMAMVRAMVHGWSFHVYPYLLNDVSQELDPQECLLHYADIVFSHGFAKALWGYRSVTRPAGVDLASEIDCGKLHAPTITKPAWQYHLQQMVVSTDPIGYLGDHLDGGQES